MTDVEQVQRQEGVTFRIESQRGTGTNDRDKMKATVHGETLEEAEAELEEALEVVEEALDSLRLVQP